jgi:FeS assembly SUF system protein
MQPEASLASHVNRSGGRPCSELEGHVIDAIRSVYDPEIPVNVYDLGLVYDIAIDAEGKAAIKMTLTAPNCPAAGILPGQVAEAARSVAGIADAVVEIAWEPQWGREMMSMAAAIDLGLI